MASVSDIVARIQSEIEDATGSPDSDWTEPDYITGKLATVGDDVAVRLQLLDLDYGSVDVILPNVPANTTSLAAYQISGGPLASMILPKSLEWRLVGQTQEDWQPIEKVEKVIDTDRGTGEPGSAVSSDTQGITSWAWLGGVVQISPASTAVDLRIRMVATPIALNNDNAGVILGLTNVLVYKTCEKICAARGGQTSGLVTYFRDCYNRACADFEGLASKTKQAGRFRLGGRRSGGGLNTTWKSPIVG